VNVACCQCFMSCYTSG